MKLPVIGILGFGYLGKELAGIENWPTDSWVACKNDVYQEVSSFGFRSVHFDWSRKETWDHLPKIPSVLVLTIPPILDEAGAEKNRIQEWCDWMEQNRADLKKLVYISSTGVYPNRPGCWCEQDQIDPDSSKGGLRLVTEQRLSESFQAVCIRSGAIYGRGRNIGERILNKKAIPKGSQRVHRIHVRDLARIIMLAITSESFPGIVNAIDRESETTDKVANWLVNQSFFPNDKDITITYSNQFQTRKFDLSEPGRKISNRVLREQCRFEYEFPTYREGLKDSFINYS
ncbi:hypothetical protein KJ966_24990 [bacterium]|nr:hypothetical protein [bacterium]